MKLAALLLSVLAQAEPKLQVARGPYVQNVRRDAATVCFWTNVECEARVRVGERVFASPSGTRHTVELSGLKPSSPVTYVVEAGPLRSEPATFRTAPAGDAPVSFVAFGDTRSGHETHAKVVDLILKQQPEFALLSGDLVERGSRSDQWDRFFEIEAPLLRSIPLYPALGNHEGNAREYFDIFVLPGEERWYSFDWGPVHAVAVDTTFTFRKNAKQLAWLKEDLAASKARFKIVFWHHAPNARSSQKARQEESRQLAEIYGPILEAGGVCLALGGHNHNYQRAEVNGVCYVTSAGGGAPLYEIGEGVELKASRKAHHICRLRAEGKRLALEAVDLGGKVFDTWTWQAR